MTDSLSNDKPAIVRLSDCKIDADYTDWVYDIKHRYRAAQIDTAVRINTSKLYFNWSVGRDLVVRKAEEKWGNGVVEQLSFDLREAFPNDKGFSSRNLWNMKGWYLFFSSNEAMEKLHQLGAELQRNDTKSIIKLHQAGAEVDSGFPMVLGYCPGDTRLTSLPNASRLMKRCSI